MKKNFSRKIYTLFHTPNILWKKFTGTCLFKVLPDKIALKILYKSIFNKKLNLKEPKTFNEKLQWLKLYDRNPVYTKMVDKYAVKEYVASIIGTEHIIPTLGVWEKFDDIDFEALPDQFVLKTTHGSGDVVICKDKKNFNIDEARKKLTKALATNYYKISREWPYKNVPPKIIAEKYMEDESGGLNDYKFMCFNGKVNCCFVCTTRFSNSGLHVTFFDRNWQVLDFERGYPSIKKGLPKPKKYEEMLDLAEKLSKDIPFVRVDFYESVDKIYFGELTFFPGGGFEKFEPEIWDKKLGDGLQLPKKSDDTKKRRNK